MHIPTKTSHYGHLTEYGVKYFGCENILRKRLSIYLKEWLTTGIMTQHKSIYSDLKSHKDSMELDILNALIWVQGQRSEEMKCGKRQWFSHKTSNSFCQFSENIHLRKTWYVSFHTFLFLFSCCCCALFQHKTSNFEHSNLSCRRNHNF